MKKVALRLVLCLILIGTYPQTRATIMPYPATIDSLALESDLVVKAKVLSVEPAKVEKDSALSNDFWKVARAKLHLISAMKGSLDSATPEFLFRSDAPLNTQQMWLDVGPENYPHFKLEPSHSYILFMKRSGPKRELIQSACNFGLRSWTGFFPAADDQAVAAGTTPHQAVWNELTRALRSKNEEEQKDAALTLLNLSCGNDGGTIGSADFERARVLESILPEQ